MDPDEVTTLNDELKQIASSSLYVNVDVNELLSTRTEQEVFDLLGKLKDLLA